MRLISLGVLVRLLRIEAHLDLQLLNPLAMVALSFLLLFSFAPGGSPRFPTGPLSEFAVVPVSQEATASRSQKDKSKNRANLSFWKTHAPPRRPKRESS